MDNATRRTLKQQDQFVTMTEGGLQWANQNRRSAITTAGIVLALIVLVVATIAFVNHRATAARTALGAAMATYQTPLALPGQPVLPGVKSYATASDRAAAANAQFADVANKYGSTEDGKVAKYFTGLTYMEEGQNQSAEDALKSVAGGWNKDLAAVARLALAQLYRNTGRYPQAESMYDELSKQDASTVPAGMAQIKLAELYTAEGKSDAARKIYAQLKDKSKDDKGKPDAIGTLAAEKLNPTPAAAAR